METTTSLIAQYFEDYGVILTNNFSLENMSKEKGIDEETLEILLQNLEDSEVMTNIANGDYDSFDPYDSYQFNDCYYSMIEELGL